MLDPETFLTELYVPVDTLCKARLPGPPHPGPAPALSASEVATLAIYGQWTRFASEAAFYRHADKHLRPLFPTLPSHAQFNRAVRTQHATIVAVARRLGEDLAAGDRAYEVVDGTGLATRNAKRRGAGWLWGQADIGKCTRLGWYEGVRLLVAATPAGAVTSWGIGIGPASTNDRTLADTFFAARADPQPGLPSVGAPVSDCYVADMGFSGVACHARWDAAGATVISAPQTGSKRAWSKDWKTWLAGIRQTIESVNDRLLFSCGLDRERPHAMDGLLARLAAAVGLHNFCAWLNRTLGRGILCTADLVDW